MASPDAPAESPDLARAPAHGVHESVLRDEEEAGSARGGRPRRRAGAPVSYTSSGRTQPSEDTKQRALHAICHWYHPRADRSKLTTKAQWASGPASSVWIGGASCTGRSRWARRPSTASGVESSLYRHGLGNERENERKMRLRRRRRRKSRSVKRGPGYIFFTHLCMFSFSTSLKR